MIDIEGLSPAQNAAIHALLACATKTQAAAKAEVSEPTLYRWLREPTFRAAYREAQRDLHEHTVTQLHTIATTAANALRSIITDENAPPASRVTASKIVLDICRGHIEHFDITERMEKIEALVELQQQKQSVNNVSRVYPH